jgi:hypothetical protein
MTTSKLWVAALCAAGVAATGRAQDLTTFSNGTVADAGAVNDNFGKVNTRAVNAQAAADAATAAAAAAQGTANAAGQALTALQSSINPLTSLLRVATGNLGLGHATPGRLLTLGTADPIISFADSGNANGHHWELQANAFSNDQFGVVRYDPNANPAVSVVIDTLGQVGIGRQGPQSKLDVEGEVTVRNHLTLRRFGAWAWRFSSSGGTGPDNYFYIDEVGNSRHLAIQSGGNNSDQRGFVGFGLNPQEGQPLNATHRITLPNNANGNHGRAIAVQWATHSSREYKTNVATLRDPVGKLLRLRGVTYDWKPEYSSGGKAVADVGFIAEEVAEVFPEAAAYDQDRKVIGLDYSRLVPVAVEAVKAQQRRIEELEARLADFGELEARLARLEALLPRPQ